MKDWRIDKVIPHIDFNGKSAQFCLYVSDVGGTDDDGLKEILEIIDKSGNVLLAGSASNVGSSSIIALRYGNILKPLSPESPNLYWIRVSRIKGRDTSDKYIMPFGVKDFRVKGKQFYLNSEYITLLGGTVVWQRWVRTREARILAYDTAWFARNVILRFKDHGANYLRFHLGVPPESLLDLCMVQEIGKPRYMGQKFSAGSKYCYSLIPVQ